MPQDRLTAKREYLENQIRKRVFAPITEISLKKSPGTNGYELHPTLTNGTEEKTLSLPLPFADYDLMLCNKRDLNEIAKAIVTDLKQIIFS
jgi:hypothetical protein